MKKSLLAVSFTLTAMLATGASATDDDFSDVGDGPDPVIINANCVWMPLGNVIICYT